MRVSKKRKVHRIGDTNTHKKNIHEDRSIES